MSKINRDSRYWCAALLLAGLALAPLGCKKGATVRVQQTEEEAPRMASTVHMGDKQVEGQLVTGFYGIEQNAWRWTARQFSVVAHPPYGAADKGAMLQVRMTVPDPVIAKLKTVSLSASVGGRQLPPETYTQAGDYVYSRDVPPDALKSDSVRLDFQLDKAMPPTATDVRELGIVVLSIGLEPK